MSSPEDNRETRNARLQKLAAEAMEDPDFVQDMGETSTAYANVDGQSWPIYDGGNQAEPEAGT